MKLVLPFRIRYPIFIKGTPHSIERGQHTVAQILDKAKQAADTTDLYQDKDGALLPVPANQILDIRGCEVFTYQVKSGGSS